MSGILDYGRDDMFLQPLSEEDEEEALDDAESDPLASDSDRGIPDDEELFGASVDALMEEGKRRRRHRRPFGRAGHKKHASEVPNHLTGRMGSAMIAYMENRLDDAEAELAGIVQEAPKAVAPYRTLALICEDKNDLPQALHYLLFAAHLDRRDNELWKKCAVRCREAGDLKKAAYCLNMALRGVRGADVDVLKERASVYAEMKDYRKAAESYAKIAKLSPDDLEVFISIADMYSRGAKPERANPYVEAAVERFLAAYPEADVSRPVAEARELAFESVVKRLVELWFGQDRFEDAAVLLGRVERRRGVDDASVLMVHRIMMAICHHRAGSRALAAITFNEFFNNAELVAANPVLMWYVGEACFASRDYAKTVKAYSAIAEHELFRGQTRLFLRRADAHLQCGQVEEALQDALRVKKTHPDNVEASFFLSRIQMHSSGRSGDALESDFRSFRRISAGILDDAVVSSDVSSAFAARRRSSGSRDAPMRPRRRRVEELLRPIADAMLSAGEAMWESRKLGAYLQLFAPVLEAGLNLEQGVLRRQPGSSLWSDDGSLTEQHLVERLHDIGEDLKSLGTCIVRNMSPNAFVTFVERLAHAILPHGSTSPAGTLAPAAGLSAVEMLSSMRADKLSSEPLLRKRVRAAVILALHAQSDSDGAYDELRRLTASCGEDPRVWWAASLRGGDDVRARATPFLRREAARGGGAARALSYGALALRSAGVNSAPRRALACYEYALGGCGVRVAGAALGAAACMLHIARSRKVLNRGQALLRAFAYLEEYRKWRGEGGDIGRWREMEIMYNVARAFDEIGVHQAAVRCYEEVLEMEVDAPPWLNLKRDAAFNVARLYRFSGNEEHGMLARAILAEYLVF